MDSLIFKPTKTILQDIDTSNSGVYFDKSLAFNDLEKKASELSQLQDILYAYDKYALLIVIQGMDASGKDSLVKNVFSGMNPQGCHVYSFKSPSSEELDHDFIWRCYNKLPQRGMIGIFNRSYYEELLIARIHPSILEKQKLPNLPKDTNDKQFWQNRFDAINAMERHVIESGTHIVKVFLHISKEEQKERFLRRINKQEKHWKIAVSDIKERQYWNEYMNCYQEILNQTSTAIAPWHVIPSDKKWYSRVAVSEIVLKKLKSLKLKYPKIDDAVLKEIMEAKRILESE